MKIKLLLKCITVLIVVFLVFVPAWASEENTEKEQFTNLVIVVDCSSSMQSSDSGWKVPDSLVFLMNACPADERIRFSLILYGTDSEIVIRDIPLTEQNKTLLSDQIRDEIYKTHYSWGLTDTGSALHDAESILNNKKGQNNNVILITDGRIETGTKRTLEASRTDVLDFASYAQDNNCVINVIALPRKTDDENARLAIRTDLDELVRKTGGSYRDLESLDIIPGLLLKFLETTLDVKSFEPEAEISADGEALYLPIDTQLISSVTVIAEKRYSETVLLESPDENWYEVTYGTDRSTELPAAPGARRVNVDGYEIIQIDRNGFDTWHGNWTLCFPDQTKEIPVRAFYVYDIQLNLNIDTDNLYVMKPALVTVCLSTGDGTIIDDLDFTKKLLASVRIINCANNSMEISESSQKDDSKNIEGADRDTLSLQGYQFVYEFNPQRVSEYIIEATLQTDTFEKTVSCGPFQVQDQLSLVSSLDRLDFRKNEPVGILAYLATQDRQRVESADYYNLSDIYAAVTNLETGIMQKVMLSCQEDEKGVYGSFVPNDPGEYEIIVYTNSARELIQRQGERMTFHITDRLPYIKHEEISWKNPIILTQKEYQLDLNTIFADDDQDVLHFEIICSSNDCSVREYDGVMHYICRKPGKILLQVVAEDNYGNQITWIQEILCMTMLEVILAILGFVILLILLAALGRLFYCRMCRMTGMLEVEITLNPEKQINEKNDIYRNSDSLNTAAFPESYLGSCIICLADQKGQEPFWIKRTMSGRKYYPLSRILEYYRKYYAASYGSSNIDMLLMTLAKSKQCSNEIYLMTNLRDSKVTIHNGRIVTSFRRGTIGELLIYDIGSQNAAVWKIRMTYF